MKRLLGILTVFYSLAAPLEAYPESQGEEERNSSSLNAGLSEYGIALNSAYKTELWDFAGNGQNEYPVFVDNFDFFIDADLNVLIGLQDTRVNASVLGNNGFQPNDYVNSSHGISNIAAPPAWKLYSFFIEKNFPYAGISALFGLYDFNSEFDSKESASIFINPAHGIGSDIAQTGVNGPSIFPVTSLGLRLNAKLADNIYIQAVALDGVPGIPHRHKGTHIVLDPNDGLFVCVEGGLDKNGDEGSRIKTAAGYWHYTDNYKNIANHITNRGIYVFADYEFYRRDNSSASFYGRIGLANPEKNRMSRFFSCGFRFGGFLAGRKNDEAALGFVSGYQAAHSDGLPGYDSNIELTCKIKLLEFLFIQPDFQYVINPHGTADRADFFVFGARALVIFAD